MAADGAEAAECPIPIWRTREIICLKFKSPIRQLLEFAKQMHDCPSAQPVDEQQGRSRLA